VFAEAEKMAALAVPSQVAPQHTPELASIAEADEPEVPEAGILRFVLSAPSYDPVDVRCSMMSSISSFSRADFRTEEAGAQTNGRANAESIQDLQRMSTDANTTCIDTAEGQEATLDCVETDTCRSVQYV
jgi:hypothetical protein